MSEVLFLSARGQGTIKGSSELVLMLSGRGNKALLPLGLQTAHVKGWKQAGDDKAEKKDMGTMVLDLTTRVRSLSFFPKDPLSESGTNREDSLPSLLSLLHPAHSFARATKHAEGQH